MPLSQQHRLRDPAERRLGKGANRKTVEAQFNRADRLLQEVVCDITNGLTHNDIIMKFREQMYDNQKKSLCEKSAKDYIKMAYLIMADNRVEEQDKLRDQFYNQYLMLYNDLVENGQPLAAKQVLDSMSKIFLPTEGKNINLNAKIDGEISIDFNFDEG